MTLVTFVIVTGVESKTSDVTTTIVVTLYEGPTENRLGELGSLYKYYYYYYYYYYSDGWCECDEYCVSDKSCDLNGT